jgi:CheY-like chemotaxis protein
MDLAQRTILVIEDDGMVLSGLQMILESWGMAVLPAEDLPQALGCLADGTPDLILSDLRLRDGVNGFDVVDRVRIALARDVPAVILTGETGRAESAEGQRRKIAFLHKPVQGEPLRRALAAGLAGEPGVMAP